MVSQRHPAIARAAAAVEAARGNWLQAGLPPNPVLSIGEQQIGSQGIEEQDFVALSQEITRGGKLGLNRQVAGQQLARARTELAAQQQRVLTDVRIAFYTALIAQKQRAVADDLVEIAGRGVKVAEQANTGTLIGRNDVLEAQIEFCGAEIEARRSYNRHLAAWRRLAAVVGEPTLPLHELQGDLDTPTIERGWDELLTRLDANSPEMAAASANLERARLASRRASVEAVPNVTVQALVNWRDNGVAGDPDGGLQVSLPLPAWNRNQGAIAQAAAEVTMAGHDIERLKLDLQNRLADVFERYASSYFQVRQYRDEILPAAKEALDLTTQTYRAGEVGYDDLLTGQRTNAQANLAYLSALRELLVAEAELNGLLLTGSLEPHD